MTLETLAQFCDFLGAIVLWKPAYQASRMKLARAAVKLSGKDRGQWLGLKKWFIERQDERELKWTEKENTYLLVGFALLVFASALKIIVSIFAPQHQ